jgi:DNA polymerase-3 subunit alpha
MGVGGTIRLPDLAEFSKGELMRMEREVTGLYLSGHPMDEHTATARKAGAVSIGGILADFAREGGNVEYRDEQRITVAGVVVSVKTKPTRNDSLMAYITIEDSTGSIELLAFQRVLDESDGCIQADAVLVVAGRLSARDEKAPQIVVDTLRPIADAAALRNDATLRNKDAPAQAAGVRTLYVKLPGEDCPEYERLKLVLTMFPGSEPLVLRFADTMRVLRGGRCVIHDALLADLREMLGEGNVVVK